LTEAATVKHNGVTVETQQLRYRRAQETLQWDAAGNLTNDAILAFTYDAADRLVEIKDRTAPTTRTELRYDYLGRRVEEKDYTVGTLTRQRRFVWAGWELIGEVDVNVSTGAKTMQRTFTWGPDLSGTIHGVAGIGGLLLVDHSSTQQTVAGADGRGNVTVLLDALATDPNTPANNLKAGVEYAPYGEIMRMTGDLAQMPFRFQSKWAMGQGWAGSWALELLDFGRRMYAPGLGRFISRDPAGETAGANLYHYCGNDPINQMDPLGLIQMRLIRLPWDPWGDSRSFASHPSLWGFFSSPFGNLDWGSDFWWDPDTGDVYGQSGGSLASVGNVNAAAGRSPGGSGRSGGGGSSGASGASGGGGSSGGSGSINTTTSRISPGSVVGDNLRQIPLLGGVLGALGDIVTGVFNTVLAPVQSGTLLRGPAQIAGGLGELVGRVLSAPDTAVGLVFGGVGCVFGATPDWDPRAAILRFTDMPTWLMPSAMSLGTVNVFGGRSPPDSDNGLAIGTSTGREESLHTVQSRMLGPLYFPLHIVAGATSILTPPGSSSNPGLPPWHRNNFLEQGPMRGRVF
jgi:RHS repeat-associated protein